MPYKKFKKKSGQRKPFIGKSKVKGSKVEKNRASLEMLQKGR